MKTVNVLAQEMEIETSNVLPLEIFDVLPGYSNLPPAFTEDDLLIAPNQLQLIPAQRLVVLVPIGEFDEHMLAHKIWQLASCLDLDVSYISLTPTQDLASYQRRRLANLAALTNYPNMQVETRLHKEKNWLQALAQTMEPGDLITCITDNYSSPFYKKIPLAKQLAKELGVPVYQLGGIIVKPVKYFLNRFIEIFAWVASLSWMGVFFLLQLWVERTYQKPQTTIFLCLTIMVELYGLWKINEFFG